MWKCLRFVHFRAQDTTKLLIYKCWYPERVVSLVITTIHLWYSYLFLRYCNQISREFLCYTYLDVSIDIYIIIYTGDVSRYYKNLCDLIIIFPTIVKYRNIYFS